MCISWTIKGLISFFLQVLNICYLYTKSCFEKFHFTFIQKVQFYSKMRSAKIKIYSQKGSTYVKAVTAIGPVQHKTLRAICFEHLTESAMSRHNSQCFVTQLYCHEWNWTHRNITVYRVNTRVNWRSCLSVCMYILSVCLCHSIYQRPNHVTIFSKSPHDGLSQLSDSSD